jgi:hypothetical protein
MGNNHAVGTAGAETAEETSAAQYESDWQWSQAQCLKFLNHKEFDGRWVAALSNVGKPAKTEEFVNPCENNLVS